jgi:hypothetical protein
MKPHSPGSGQVHPMAHMTGAHSYYGAAMALHPISDARDQAGTVPRFTDPLYYLYFHAAELALKASLGAHNRPFATTAGKGHSIKTLYEDCVAAGLPAKPDDRFDLGNVIGLLQSGNDEQGFRYFRLKGTAIPDLDWTRDAVGDLVGRVASDLHSTYGSRKPGPAVRASMIFHRPVDKNAPAAG